MAVLQDYQTATYDGTGEQTMLDVNPNHVYSVLISGNSSDDYTLQFAHTIGGTRYDMTGVVNQSSQTDIEVTAPVAQLGLDITTNNSGAITLTIRTAPR